MKNLVLRPNCLLTKAPLVFVPGPRSLFYYEPVGQEVQHYLSEHGYQVLSLPLPFRSRPQRQLVFQRWLEAKKNQPFHFIMGPETFAEFNNQIQFQPESTFTVIGQDFIIDSTRSGGGPLIFRAHQLFCRIFGVKPERYEHTLKLTNDSDYDRFLDHCVQLAENEMTGD
ncbi:MAG: hypothetical protein H7061_03715 [Bdellovibrionaceae bacterium]|nr:hypothetical protein [Bdellovibrio sp.]